MEKLRIGVVGAGWISQAAFMPGVEHTGNTVMSALVTGDPKKAYSLAKRYGIEHTYDYSQYTQMLDDGVVDAVYIATPNAIHRQYAVPALLRGVHVLLEKPMEVSEENCLAIQEAARTSGAKLMIAYRLHFEPGTLEALRLVRDCELGEIRFFSSVFAQHVAPDNYRAHGGYWAGPVADMGPYPINMARNVFGAEPLELMAIGGRDPVRGYDFDDTVSVVMRFPEQRVAQFTVCYGGTHVDQFRIVGTKGELEVTPAYGVNLPVTHFLNGQKHKFSATDQFGGELKYFAECVLAGRDPEPDGAEGIADVRVIAAIERSLSTGLPQTIVPTHRSRRIEPGQVEKLHKVREPKLVNAAPPGV